MSKTDVTTTPESFQRVIKKNESSITPISSSNKVEPIQQRTSDEPNLGNDKNLSRLNSFSISGAPSTTENSTENNKIPNNDLISQQNDPSTNTSTKSPYSEPSENSHPRPVAKVKLNLDKLSHGDNISRMEAAVKTHQNGTDHGSMPVRSFGTLESSNESVEDVSTDQTQTWTQSSPSPLMAEILTGVSASEPETLLTAIQNDRNMTEISSEFLTSSQAGAQSSDNDYHDGTLTANGDYFDYSDQHYHTHYYQDYYYEYVTGEGHSNDYSMEVENNEETLVEQKYENTSNVGVTTVTTALPVEINPTVEFTGDDIHLPEEINDIHDEDTSDSVRDTPNNEQKQYYDVTTEAEPNSHETLIEKGAKTDDFEYEEAGEINAIDVHEERVHYDENNNENDDSFAREQQQNLSSLMQFLDSPHRETTTNFVPSLHGAQTDIVRTNINYSDDSRDPVSSDDHADTEDDHNETTESHDNIIHPLVTVMGPDNSPDTSHSLKLLIKPSFHFPDSKVIMIIKAKQDERNKHEIKLC